MPCKPLSKEGNIIKVSMSLFKNIRMRSLVALSESITLVSTFVCDGEFILNYWYDISNQRIHLCLYGFNGMAVAHDRRVPNNWAIERLLKVDSNLPPLPHRFFPYFCCTREAIQRAIGVFTVICTSWYQGIRIQGDIGFVQNQKDGISQIGSGQGNSLTLSTS
jgi:hypothetical protein